MYSLKRDVDKIHREIIFDLPYTTDHVTWTIFIGFPRNTDSNGKLVPLGLLYKSGCVRKYVLNHITTVPSSTEIFSPMVVSSLQYRERKGHGGYKRIISFKQASKY